MEVGVDPEPRRRFWTWEDHSRDRKTVKDELKKVKKHLSSYFAFSSESIRGLWVDFVEYTYAVWIQLILKVTTTLDIAC
jgi:hypothetical protein